jgi:hypothetical protein
MGVPLYVWQFKIRVSSYICTWGISAPKWHDADVCVVFSPENVQFTSFVRIHFHGVLRGRDTKNLLMIMENSQIIINTNNRTLKL